MPGMVPGAPFGAACMAWSASLSFLRSVIKHRTLSRIVVFTRLNRCLPDKPTEAAPSAIAAPSRDTTMLTVRVRRTSHHAFCQGVLFGRFSSFLFAFCSCLLIFCFRPLSLSFLPLSPIAYLLSRCPSSSHPAYNNWVTVVISEILNDFGRNSIIMGKSWFLNWFLIGWTQPWVSTSCQNLKYQ